MGSHSQHSASGMYRWSVCAGSIKLCETVPAPVQSAYAAEGTMAHDIAAKLLKDGGEVVKVDAYPDMADAVMEYVKLVNAYRKQDSVHREWIERRFDLSSVYPGCFGTSDYVIYQPLKKKLVVIDYKHGSGVWVSPKENPQLKYYGLGALVDLKLNNVETVELGICQPRCGDGEYRSIEIDALDLQDFRVDLIQFAKATEDPKAPLVSGEHCRFCPAAGICPELNKTRQEVAKMEFKAELSYSPEELSKALAARPAVQAWLKGLDEFAYAEMEAGRQIPGWKLVDKRATRKWKDDDDMKIRDTLLEAGCDPFAPSEYKSPTQIEKLDKKAYALVEQYVVKESSGHTIAPETDKRPAVRPKAQEEFANVDVLA
jgi:hypothetical protein